MTIGAAMWNGECMQSWCIDSAMIYLLRLNDTPSTVHKSGWPMKFLAQKGHGAAFCVCSHTADLSIDVARRRSVSAPTSCSSSCTAPTTCIYRRKNTTVFFWRFLLRVAFRVMRICGYADTRMQSESCQFSRLDYSPLSTWWIDAGSGPYHPFNSSLIDMNFFQCCWLFFGLVHLLELTLDIAKTSVNNWN